MTAPTAGSGDRIGLEAFLATEAFQQAMKVYTSGIEAMNKATASVASSMTSNLGKANTLFKAGVTQVSSAVGSLGNTLGNVFYKGVDLFNIAAGTMIASMDDSQSTMQDTNYAAMALAVAVGNVLANAFQNLAAKVKDFVQGGIMAAARVQELDYVLQILGNRAGYSYDQLQSLVKGMVEYGIQTDEATNSMIQFIRYNLDLSKATQLARVAQDAAVIAQLNSSETLQRIIYGITTYNTEVLRTIGIQMNMQQAMEDYAKTLNKSADALTTNERAQAVMNGILQEGVKIAGAYEAAMEAPGKQLRSLTRDMFELTKVLGQPFLNAFGDLVYSARELAKGFRILFDEGGPLRNLMYQIGGAAAYFTGIIKDASKAFADWAATASMAGEAIKYPTTSIQKLFGSMTDGSKAVGAFNEAINTLLGIVGNLAPNLATLALTVGAVVAAFLAVKVVAGLIVGAFTLAGSVIAGLGAALSFLLSPIGLVSAALVTLAAIVVGVLVRAGDDARKTMTELANEAVSWGFNLISSLADGMIQGIVAVLNAIAWIGNAIAGWLMPGSPPKILPDIDDWGRKTMEEFLKGMKGAVSKIDPFTDLSKLITDKLLQMTSTFQFQANKLKKLVSLIGKSISLTVYNFGKDQDEKKKKEEEPKEPGKPKGGGGGGKGGGGTTPKLPELPGGGGVGIVDKIKSSIDAAKKAFAQKIQEFIDEIKKKVQPITTAWNNLVADWTPIVERALASVQIVLDKGLSLDSVNEALKNFFPPETWENIDTITGEIKAMQQTFDALAVTINNTMKTMGLSTPEGSTAVGTFVNTVLGFLATLMKGASVVFLWFSAQIAGVVQGIATAKAWIEQVTAFFRPFWDEWKKKWDEAGKAPTVVQMVVQRVLGVILAILVGALQIISYVFAAIIGYVAGFVKGVIDFFNNLYKELIGGSIVPDMMQDIYDEIVGVIGDIIAAIGKKATDFYNAGRDLLQGLIDGAESMLTNLITAITNIVKSAVDAAKRAFGIDSPSKVFGWIAKMDVQGMIDEFHKATPKLSQAVDAMLKRSVSGKLGNIGAGISNQLANSVQLGSTAFNTSNVYHIDRSTKVEVNPTYKNVESPATVYNDVMAALVSARF